MVYHIVVVEDVHGPVLKAYRSGKLALAVEKLARANCEAVWRFGLDPDRDFEFPSLEAELEELYDIDEGELDFDAWREAKDEEYWEAVREHFEPWHHDDV